jgi:hypothetical protein
MWQAQVAHFLWQWSHRRRLGPIGFAGLGAAVAGVLGGTMFGGTLGLLESGRNAKFTDDAPRWWVHLASAVGLPTAAGLIFGGAFVVVGAVLGLRVFWMQERQRADLLAQGHPVPASRPEGMLPPGMGVAIRAAVIIAVCVGTVWGLVTFAPGI